MLAQPSKACARWTYLLKKNCLYHYCCNFSTPAYLTSQNIPEVQNTVHCIMCNVYKRCQSLFFASVKRKKQQWDRLLISKLKYFLPVGDELVSVFVEPCWWYLFSIMTGNRPTWIIFYSNDCTWFSIIIIIIIIIITTTTTTTTTVESLRLSNMTQELSRWWLICPAQVVITCMFILIMPVKVDICNCFDVHKFNWKWNSQTL